MQYVVLIGLMVIAYLLGSIPAAYLVAKWAKGIDLRKYGSGNVGFTNLAASTSRWLAIPVLIFDLGKGTLAVYIAKWAGLPLYMQALVGVAAIAGHNWPVFLGFNAGRGVLTSIGVVFGLVPKLAPFLVVLSFVGIPFHLLPVTALICIFLLPVLTWFSNMPVVNWFFISPLGGERLAVTLVCFILWILVPVRRMTVPVSSVSKSVSRGELLFNLVFFDRDIRDRQAWLQRSPDKPTLQNSQGRNI
jgi:glycerol-3-phosphate acyltransferase PlsY